MRINTALNHRDRAKRALRDLARSAETYGLLSETINARKGAIYATVEKCPAWVMEYLRGYWEGKTEGWRYRQVFAYNTPKGRFTARRDREDYYGYHGIDPGEVYKTATTSGHYWVIGDDLKPYFVSEAT